MAFSTDASEIVLSSYTDIQIWDARKLKQKLSFHAHDEVIWSLFISPTGKEIISSDAHVTKFWDPSNGKLLKQVHTSSNARTFSVAISPDGRMLATSTDDCGSKIAYFCGDISLWDISSQKIIKRVDIGDTPIGLQFMEDGQTLLVTSYNRGVSLWKVPDLIRQRVILEGYLTTAKIYPETTKLSPDGSSYAVVITEQSRKNPNEYWGGVYVISTGNLQVIRKIERLQEAVKRDVQYFPGGELIVFSDGPRIIVTSPEGETTTSVLRHDSKVTRFAASPLGNVLVTSTLFGDLVFWGIGENAMQVATPVPTWESPTSLVVYDDFEGNNIDFDRWQVNIPRPAIDPLIQQKNGNLFMQASRGKEDVHMDIVMKKQLDDQSDEMEAFEIRVRIPEDRDRYGNNQSVYISFSAQLSNGVYWAARCSLIELVSGPYFQCTVENSKNGEQFNEYITGQKRLKEETWYNVRLELDRRSGAVQFYLDNKLYDHYDPFYAELIRRSIFTPGIGITLLYDETSSAQALFDDAMITGQ